MNNLIKTIQKWLNIDNERETLQRFYLSVAIISLVIAALLSLANHDLGSKILIITIISSVIFFSNSVVWALGKAFSGNFLPVKKPTSAKKKTSKK